MGLNDAYLLAGNKTAKKVLVNLADYLVDVLAGLTDEQVQTMLNCEFGGMNEAFAQVYAPVSYTHLLPVKKFCTSMMQRLMTVPGVYVFQPTVWLMDTGITG